jgi:hypothetical protein
MQNLQSQLGKSLSLQLLMTVPRRKPPGERAVWLQTGALDFSSCCRSPLGGSNSFKFPRRFKSLGPRFAMQQRPGIPNVARI